ncbi:ABC-2 type transport system ATP-binding protein [Rhizomicrobium palustre]|uniref:ABC-2 type transport system ATP-binding protein n=1 Tax=Rhizomicrobium palustre TaxID=189966 RepID=A0A846MZ56_9PROT|nr:ABC transporter ATP-binding protein [Rhizomicrobium palustre]NIK88292.1 ABC-2 type transport system ATP-binding protein [Rhizomicrobium palustre]
MNARRSTTSHHANPSGGTAKAIDVQNLTKRFGKKVAVNGVDIAVPKGEVWGFLGPNGSGKTTTIRMLCGLLHADDGQGTCLGYDFRREADAIKRETGYMTQRFSFWEDLSIRENLEFVARVYGLSNRRALVDDCLEKLGLASRQKQLAGELSGGWKQRMALAACTLHSPKLLLLDEPTAGVDPKARRDFWNEIHRLSGEGITVLVSTHYMDEAERCDQIVFISYGDIVARGPVREIIRQSGLITFTVGGEGARQLADRLRGQPGVASVAFFGALLHVSGYDREVLERALAPYRGDPKLTILETDSSLEDVFIQLQEQAIAKGAGA